MIIIGKGLVIARGLMDIWEAGCRLTRGRRIALPRRKYPYPQGQSGRLGRGKATWALWIAGTADNISGYAIQAIILNIFLMGSSLDIRICLEVYEASPTSPSLGHTKRNQVDSDRFQAPRVVWMLCNFLSLYIFKFILPNTRATRQLITSN